MRFWLPDDWEGTVADALRAAADFLEDGSAGLDELPAGSGHGASHHTFWYNSRAGLRMSAELGVFEACEPSWRWARCDRVVKYPRGHIDDARVVK